MWQRRPRSPEGAQAAPLVFFHGLCGFTGYLPLLWQLLRGGRGALLLEMEDVSLSLQFEASFLRPLTRTRVVAAISHALGYFDTDNAGKNGKKTPGAAVVGHSLGTVMATWLVADAPDCVSSLSLVDPICLLLHLPDVARGFLDPTLSIFPSRARAQTSFEPLGGGTEAEQAPRSSLMAYLMFALVSTEAGVALFFRRNFLWSVSQLARILARLSTSRMTAPAETSTHPPASTRRFNNLLSADDLARWSQVHDSTPDSKALDVARAATTISDLSTSTEESEGNESTKLPLLIAISENDELIDSSTVTKHTLLLQYTLVLLPGILVTGRIAFRWKASYGGSFRQWRALISCGGPVSRTPNS